MMKRGMWSTRLAILFAVLVLTGCTVCPPSNDMWSTDITDTPVQTVSGSASSSDTASRSESTSSWEWQDGAEKWHYSGRNTPQAPASQWVYESKSIVLHLRSDTQLNSYLGQPHTLMVKVLQLTDVAVISEFKESAFGLSDLMSDKATTLSSSILKETPIMIGPDQTRRVVIDREQDARYIVLIAGYFDSDAKSSVRIMAIPSVEPRILPCYDSSPWPFRDPPPPTPDDVPARLKMWLTLDASAIGGLSVTAQ